MSKKVYIEDEPRPGMRFCTLCKCSFVDHPNAVAQHEKANWRHKREDDSRLPPADPSDNLSLTNPGPNRPADLYRTGSKPLEGSPILVRAAVPYWEYPCGCKASALILEYCRLHAHAEEMRDAIHWVLKQIEMGAGKEVDWHTLRVVYDKVKPTQGGPQHETTDPDRA